VATGVEPSASNQQSIDTSNVTTRPKPLGALGECCEDSDCQYKPLDDSLLRIIAVWEILPVSRKKGVNRKSIASVQSKILFRFVVESPPNRKERPDFGNFTIAIPQRSRRGRGSYGVEGDNRQDKQDQCAIPYQFSKRMVPLLNS
jgi:hypothetical protein